MGQSCHAVSKKSSFTMVKNENKELSKLEFPRKFEFASTIGSLMHQLVRTISHFPSLIKCLNVSLAMSITISWTVTRGILRFPLLWRTKKRLFSHVYLGYLLIIECLLAYTIPQQCFNVTVESFL